MYTYTKPLLHLKSGIQFRKEYRKIVRARKSEGVLKTMSPKDVIEAIAMKSHQHDFLTISLNKDNNR